VTERDVTDELAAHPTEPAGGAEFLADFAVLSAIGATPGGGVERQAGSAEDGQMRDWFSRWLRDRGFDVRVDPVGNLIGLLELVAGAPYIAVGSHLDSQPRAGKYDGAYGVLAGAHAVYQVSEALRASGAEPRFNLAVVDWFNEEGSRFKPSLMGSGVHTAALPLDRALATRDPRGISVREALADIGYLGAGTMPEIAGYAEVHIEQGPGMEASGTRIGAVDRTWCANKYEVVVTGEQSHTGSTPMPMRRDALLGAAHLVVAVNELTGSFDEGQLHTSVGELTVEPNSPVVVAREVRLLMDIRSRTSDLNAEAFALLEGRIAEIEAATRTSIDIVSRSIWASGPFPASGIKLVEEVADALALPRGRVPTLAGHDATNMNAVVPTLLFFVPSVDGISHCEREFTRDEDLVAGLSVMTGVLDRLARHGFSY
jgi:N-carbamoyl-L-amino-acid hydrolase